MRTTCNNPEYGYCRINKTGLVSVGKGSDLECPVCGAYYPGDNTPPRYTPEQNQKVIDNTIVLTPFEQHLLTLFAPLFGKPNKEVNV